MNRSKGSPSDRSITLVGRTVAASDFLQLNPAEAPRGGMSDWLARQIRRAVAEGLLPAGSRLPATRVLADELGVSRGVVTEAYRRLTEDGHVEGRGRAGTVVLAAPLARPTEDRPTEGRASEGRASGQETAGRRSAGHRPAGRRTGARDGGAEERALFGDPLDTGVFDALRAAPARVDLSPGLPDLAAFPRAAWLRAERAVLAGLVPADFGYGDPRGTPALRRAVARWLALNRGIAAHPDEVLIVAGTAQALGLLALVLKDEGVTRVALEDPSSLGIRQHLRNSGLQSPPVPVDERGVRVDLLRATGARVALLTPAHQFPTGVVLDGVRRRELADWARDGGLIIEDDYDAEHRYDRPPVPALRSTLADHVAYAGSVSKLLAPALRVGWLLAPRRYRDALVDAKRFADLGNAALPQLVLAHLMESGELERHLRFLRRRHRGRRDAMIAALADRLPGAVVHGAAAGLHLTVTFEGAADDIALAAAALERGVKVQPLSWHAQRPGRPGLVLGYAASTPSDIREGVAVLGDLLH
ncbi:MocR-like pyridoxine biosynthesis transcription factor PdxR [Streptomyces flavofungini]|uniref:PLP-dependent aminotransferase family protein n=1 Tax=Streptomyces flavofungini TaxID=68200 RepID=A0ABS0XD53_9ACTN|nr:PLP-dependent aminotransferase family protein [Streptomyces flavofungini]MBJ3811147.1 PLP-dependent aminotransferase family protein [Streptomyces flavofungini]GHC67738.1 GntR family transcriptional regulator [Streptomyces flavofungini]